MRAKRLKQALTDLNSGRPVLVYDADDREGEVDMIYAAEHITHEKIARLRNDAGGLICVAVAHAVAERLDIPYYRDAVNHASLEIGEQAYGDRSSFALWVNHTDTYTGITDNDRARTITALAGMAGNDDTGAAEFAAAFDTPGHAAILRAAEGLLQDRQGHTEIGVYLAQKAYCTPAAVVCEMLGDATGDAMSKKDAEAYADEHGIVFLGGEQVLRDWEETVEKINVKK